MKSANRENLIVLPVLIGFAIEFFIKYFYVGSVSFTETYALDTKLKILLFVFSFYVFYAVVPKSKRLLAFMSILLVSCIFNMLFMYNSTYVLFYNELVYMRFNSTISFSLIYRSIEVFIIFAWIGGIKNNVNYVVNRFNNNDSSFSYRNKRRLQ